jgi:hypothetical protein
MTPVREYIRELRIGDPVAVDNMTMAPILSRQKVNGEPDYLLLEEAVRSGAARAEELEAATVRRVLFENLSECPVLLLGGEELAGARQNRIVNLTILAPPRSKIVIPVSCVEAGRWRPVSRAFKPTESVAFPRLRARSHAQVTRSLRLGIGYETNQNAVWREVDAKLSRLGVISHTSAMREAFENRSAEVNRYVGAFRWQEGQTGALFAIDGQPAGLDVFDHPRTCQKMLERLARGYALDAVESRIRRTAENSGEEASSGGGQSPGNGSAAALRAWMDSIGEAEVFTRVAIGRGDHVRVESNKITGAALWAEDRYIHLCAFPINPARKPEEDDPFLQPIWRRPGRARY